MGKANATQQEPTPQEHVKTLKVHMETLERVRNLEKDARQRLQKEGLSTADQKLWAEILHEAIKAIEKLEKGLTEKLHAIA